MQLLTESSDIEMVMAELAGAWERGDADAGRWLITAFHNTKRKPLMEAVMFRFAPQTRPARPTR